MPLGYGYGLPGRDAPAAPAGRLGAKGRRSRLGPLKKPVFFGEAALHRIVSVRSFPFGSLGESLSRVRTGDWWRRSPPTNRCARGHSRGWGPAAEAVRQQRAPLATRRARGRALRMADLPPRKRQRRARGRSSRLGPAAYEGKSLGAKATRRARAQRGRWRVFSTVGSRPEVRATLGAGAGRPLQAFSAVGSRPEAREEEDRARIASRFQKAPPGVASAF